MTTTENVPSVQLTFNTLRNANTKRLPTFKNAKGQLAHSKPDGSDWLLSQWSNAILGELGEAANIIKKIERGDFTLDEAREELSKELADVQTYLDLLSFRAGIDLGKATADKFNEVSKRVKSPVLLIKTNPDLNGLIFYAVQSVLSDERANELRTLSKLQKSANPRIKRKNI